MKIPSCMIAVFLCAFILHSQTADAYKPAGSEKSSGLLDMSRLSVHHAAIFGMSSGFSSPSLQSQGMYLSMLQYQFAKPVTLNLNFGVPLFSTFNQSQNLNAENIQSADYFKNMPFDASLSWQPTNNMLMRLSISRNTYTDAFGYGYRYDPFYDTRFNEDRPVTTRKNK